MGVAGQVANYGSLLGGFIAGVPVGLGLLGVSAGLALANLARASR